MFSIGFAPLLASVVFRVGILGTAGTLTDIQVSGNDGPCAASGPTVIRCEATTAVTFSWAGDAAYEMVGEKTVYPGHEGYAWVLATNTHTQAHRARLESETLDAQTVRELYVRTGANTPPPPSLWMVNHLRKLASHPDPSIRIAAAEGAHPWFAGTPLDPMPVDSPPLLTEKLLVKMSRDKHKGVRRRVLHMLRDLRPPYSRTAAQSILMRLANDPHRGVQRNATATLKRAHQVGIISPEEAWTRALQQVPKTGNPGRAACNTLAHLARWVEPSEAIRPDAAIDLALKHHTERVWRLWTAWRKTVPLDARRADFLLANTVGLAEPLLKHWAKTNPELLLDILMRWEPSYPHSPRWDQIGVWFERVKDPNLRALFELPREPPKRMRSKMRVRINLKDVSREQPEGN